MRLDSPAAYRDGFRAGPAALCLLSASPSRDSQQPRAFPDLALGALAHAVAAATQSRNP